MKRFFFRFSEGGIPVIFSFSVMEEVGNGLIVNFERWIEVVTAR